MVLIVYTHVNMSTFVHDAFDDSAQLTIPSVRVVVRTHSWPTVLGKDGNHEYGHRMPMDMNAFKAIISVLTVRDWRKLRAALVNLDLENLSSVCGWLGAAGYIPQVIVDEPSAVYFTAQDVQRMSANNLGWKTDFVTPGIQQWLKDYRDVFAWLMTIEEAQFRKSIKAAREYFADVLATDEAVIRKIQSGQRPPKLKDPAMTFLKEVGAPEVDPKILGLALRGTAISETAPARFFWDDDGKPSVAISADWPIAAICLSIHIDRNFSSRSWAKCERCGRWLEQIRGRDRFCSKKCRNYFTTTARREKLRQLRASMHAWEQLAAKTRLGHDRWQWIARHVKRESKSLTEIDPLWAKQEGAKMKAQKGNKAARKTT